MELRQLRYFMRIYESRSFTAAAKALGVSQSALSLSIKELEASLDTKVFHRSSLGIDLTEAGEELLDYASAILRQHEKALADVSEIRDIQNKTLDFGVNAAFPRKFLDAVLELFYERAPGVTVKLFFSAHPVDAVITNLRRNIWDAAISLDPDLILEEPGMGVICEDVSRSRSDLYARSDHPIHAISDVTRGDLMRFPWAVSTTVESMRMFEALHDGDNTSSPNVALYSDSFDLILGAVSRMDFLCIAPRELVEASGSPLQRVEQSVIDPFVSQWKLMYCEDLRLSSPARMLLRCVRQVFNTYSDC